MRFIDPEMETRYSVEKEKQSGAAFSCSCVVLFFTALVEVFIDPWYVWGGRRGWVVPAHLWPRGASNLSPLGSFFLGGRLVANYVTFVVGEILLLILTLCSLAAIFPRVRRLKGGGMNRNHPHDPKRAGTHQGWGWMRLGVLPQLGFVPARHPVRTLRCPPCCVPPG